MSGVPGRVLVVDDNKVIRQLIRVNLELEGFEVVTAADGVECLDVVEQVQPDLITLDVVMPRLDGLRTAAHLRSDARTRDLPIVVISACTQYEVEGGLEVGVDAFLAKPFEPSELVGVVRQLVERSGQVVARDQSQSQSQNQRQSQSQHQNGNSFGYGYARERGAVGSECRTGGAAGSGGPGAPGGS
ncbi:response regulator [Streptomyces sp. NPDC047123]|uniref:response regulator n=1 Tax=Streptomyces sp. NPDC047123 TaxID=3155622 RepID=UPI0033E5151B